MVDSRRNSTSTMSRWLTSISFGGYGLALAALVAFALWAMRSVDEAAVERQANFVTSGLSEIFARVPREQESVTIWDDAVVKTRENDQVWMLENIGEWVGDYFGHDAVFVLDDADRPIQVMRDGRTIDADNYWEYAGTIKAAVDQLRATIANLAPDQLPSRGELGLSVHARFGNVPAVFSIKPIVPYTKGLPLAPGTEYLHVSVRRADTDVLGEIANRYSVSGLRILSLGESSEGLVSRPILDDSGSAVAVIAWEGYRPGTALIRAASPGILIVVVVGGAFLAWLLRRLRQSAVELQASEAQAHFLAFHDSLTGLPNRALFEDQLQSALRASSLRDHGVAVHTLDIDRFKHVNDSRGHVAGDELLRQVAARLTSVTRASDMVARIGGDEFIFVQSKVRRPSEALWAARRILRAFRQPFDVAGSLLHVSASIGTVLSGDQTTALELQRRADIALYEAKARGRARVALFKPEMDNAVRQRRQVEQDLRLALELGSQLQVVYQPVFSTGGHQVCGAEALVRWQHPTAGRISPDQFIGIAEESALIEPLGEFVLAEAAAFAKRTGLPWVAVNVSAVQLRNVHFADKVVEILGAAGLAPTRLQLEITESVLIENPETVAGTLKQLRSQGVRVALDDFGTGYSSINYLRRYAIDKLKIDQSFVAELGISRDADAIVRSMVGLARSLRLTVTAEGVETREHLLHLSAIGCHELQGYYLSRPIDGAALEDFLVASEHGRVVPFPRPPEADSAPQSTEAISA